MKGSSINVIGSHYRYCKAAVNAVIRQVWCSNRQEQIGRCGLISASPPREGITDASHPTMARHTACALLLLSLVSRQLHIQFTIISLSPKISSHTCEGRKTVFHDCMVPYFFAIIVF